MGKKGKLRSKRKRKLPPGDLMQRARRELAKGNAKSALKDAKLCFQDAPSPEHRQLLEEVYLGRVEQLYGMRLLDEARAALRVLIELKPTDREVCGQLPRVQLLLGESGEEAARLLEQDAALLTKLADEAVLDCRCSIPDHPQAKPYVEQVRQALSAVEQGDDEAACRLVEEIPRSSPLCDWKLLVRGLAAFYQGDDARSGENWRRLDPARSAWPIAQTLLVASGQLRAQEAAIDTSSSIRRLESHLQADPAGRKLKELAALWQQAHWKEFFRAYRNFQVRFVDTRAELIESIVDLIWKRAVREQDAWLLEEIIRIGPAPPLDPRWNRARALLAERIGDSDVDPVVEHWMAYVQDVETLSCLPAEERSIAAGLVYLHLARKQLQYARENERLFELSPFSANDDDEHVAEFLKDAEICYQRAIECNGQLVSAYHELAELHEQQDEPSKSAAVFKRLICEKPDDYDAHLWLANYELGRDQPDQSQPHVDAAARLQPRDTQTATLRWNHRVTAIRCLVKKRRFEDARREVEEAACHAPAEMEPFTLHTIRAGIELKAKNREAAEEHLQAALATLDEPTAVWMQMSCIAARYSLAREIKKDFDDRFKKAIGRKPISQTAGCLARFLTRSKLGQINYTGRATQQRLVLRYLENTRALRWQQRDLCDVCSFLQLLPRQRGLLQRLVDVGVRRFPECPQLQLMAAEEEMEAGPLACNFVKARGHAEQALELARKPGHPEENSIAEQAERLIALVDEMERRFASPWMFGDEDEDDEDQDDEYDEAFEDDDEDQDDEYDEAFEDDDEGEPGGPWTDGFEAMPEGLNLEEFLDAFMRTLPSGLRKQLSQSAAARGVSIKQLLRSLLEKGRSPRTAEEK